MTRSAAWIITLENVPGANPSPVVLGRHLGIPRSETMRLLVAIADALRGLAGELTPKRVKQLEQDAEGYRDAVAQVVETFSFPVEELPEDLRGLRMELEAVYHRAVLRTAIGLLTQLPAGTRELHYQGPLIRQFDCVQIFTDEPKP
jgi:hypothetical protein